MLSFQSFLMLLGIDVVFIILLIAGAILLQIVSKPAFAVLRRNFVGYFSNPTGYVFLCVFVVLTSAAAFVPQDFFNNNLANLDQLNKYLPLVMLVFIPAITMSTWAEERRQGTDELLLTLPTTDFDIVLGKYLASAMIFTISLLFSQLCTFQVLSYLTAGDMDLGLFCTTYIGYWMMGLAMLSIGMVASFLTNNLTVGFVLGVALNAPLALMSYAHLLITRDTLARSIEHWGLLEQFSDYGRGVVSLSSTTFFVMLIAIGQYVCMVLIGRRHWLAGSDGQSMLGHFALRAICLIVAAVGLTYFFSRADARWDLTEGDVNSLSTDTVQQIRDLEPTNTVYIDAYISENIPEAYAETRFQLVSLLNEFQAMAPGKVEVRVHKDIDPFGDQADQAEERYGIRPQSVTTDQRGVYRSEDIILGAAFTCGLEKVVVPFFDYGVPVEYELVRSITTVAKGQRDKIGVLTTDAKLMGSFTMGPGGQPMPIPKEAIIEELEKQYDVEEVDPNVPIATDKYKVLLVVQPSSLSDPQIANLIRAIRAGQPTAIFEDPLPQFIQAPGTGDPKRPDPMMARFGQAPEPKGDIRRLWDLLEIENPSSKDSSQPPEQQNQYQLVWQSYNPYPKFGNLSDALVIVREGGAGSFDPDDPITASIEEVLFPYPGLIVRQPDPKLTFTPLVSTGEKSGLIMSSTFRENFRDPAKLQAEQGTPPADAGYVLAARIQGEPKKSESPLFPETAPEGEDNEPKEIDVVYVADLDLMGSDFLRVRARPDQEINFRFDNVNFVLNIIDGLAGDERFINIRGRRLHLSTLKYIERLNAEAKAREQAATEAAQQELDDRYEELEQETDREIEKAQAKVDELERKASVDEGAKHLAREKAAVAALKGERRKATEQRRMKAELAETNRENERQTNLDIRNVERRIKLYSVVIPPIIPLVIGFLVFVMRRLREREGVSKTRLRW